MKGNRIPAAIEIHVIVNKGKQFLANVVNCGATEVARTHPLVTQPAIMTKKNIILLLASAVVAGLLFDSAQVPVPWLCGSMVVGIACALIRGGSQKLPSTFEIVGQVIIGIATAARFPLQTLELAATHAVPLLLIVVFTGSMSLLNGYLLERWAGVDRATSFLGCLPGASSSIVAMSSEMGADAIAVAVLQYLRLLMVVFLVPIAVNLLFPADALTQATSTIPTENGLPVPMLLNLLVLAACGILGIWCGGRLRLPSPVFLGPFFVGLITFWVLPYHFQVPTLAFNGGLLLVGLPIGLRFDWQKARKLLKAVLIETGLVIVLILVCLAVGYAFHLVTGVDTMTAVLGSTPGGMQVMIASAVEFGSNSGLVLAMQMTRMLIILSIGPWLATKLIKSSDPTSTATPTAPTTTARLLQTETAPSLIPLESQPIELVGQAVAVESYHSHR